MSTRIFGSGIRRREDPRLLTGTATYTDDLTLPRMVHAAMLRSPHAHAKITSIDTSKAAAAAGVVAVYTHADTEGALQPAPCAWLLPDSDLKVATYHCIAKDVVRYVGDIVAVVVAEDRYAAEDALELIEVDYEPLPAVTDPEAAAADGAPQLHEEILGNQAFHWTVAGGDIDAAFENADVVVSDRIIQQRLIPNAMEPKAALASYTAATGELTLWLSTQAPHIVRFLSSLVCGLGEDKIRVVAPEVGGGFGSKMAAYPADYVAVFCSMRLGRPVKWNETRSEAYQATTHGRDHVQQVELAAKKDGTLLGLRCTVHAGMGAYLSTAAPGIPTILHGLMLSGVYTLPAVKEDVYGIYENATPVEAYRGAGRPEATFMLERMMDVLAAEIGMDPADVRKKNLIPKFDDGHDVVTGLTYDSGDYPAALDKVLNHVDYAGLRAAQAAAPTNDIRTGLGLGSYVEICGLGPSQVAGAIGFQGGLWESAIVRFHPSGKVHVFIGASPHGQGEETTFAQIIGSELGVDPQDVKVFHGDTDNTPMGWGTYGSRTTAVGGAALALTARKIRDKAKVIAAHLLEAAVEDMDYDDGKFFVKGSPDQHKTITEIALMANVAWNMPEGVEAGLEASDLLRPTKLRLPVRRALRTGRGRHRDRCRHPEALCRTGRLRPADQPGHRRGAGARRCRAGYRAGPLGRSGLRRERSTGDRQHARLRAAARRHAPGPRGAEHRDPVAASPAGGQGHRRSGHDRLDGNGLQRRDRRPATAGVTSIRMPLTPERVWQAIQQAKG